MTASESWGARRLRGRRGACRRLLGNHDDYLARQARTPVFRRRGVHFQEGRGE